MIFDGALSPEDQQRAERTLGKLLSHGIESWALTGGFATEIFIRRAGSKPIVRPLHDLDFLVSSFANIPTSIGRDFLFRHVHPFDPPGKNLLQCVDPETGVRVDIFRVDPPVMNRTSPLNTRLQIISQQDLTARAARLTWDLGRKSVAPKYVRDFLRLLKVADIQSVEAVWQQHRNAWSPPAFSQAAKEVHTLIESHASSLIDSPYSTDIHAICDRCHTIAAFPLADAQRIISILGYC